MYTYRNTLYNRGTARSLDESDIVHIRIGYVILNSPTTTRPPDLSDAIIRQRVSRW